MTLRRLCIHILLVVGVACVGCRHKKQAAAQAIPISPPATAPAGSYRVARDGIVLMLELQPEVRWSAHATIRVRNEGDGEVYLLRHANSILHDYQLKVLGVNGEEIPTRMMLRPGEPGRATRLALQPGHVHEEGMQLGMLFALRAGEKYLSTVQLAVHLPEKPEPVVLEIRDAGFAVVAD